MRIRGILLLSLALIALVGCKPDLVEPDPPPVATTGTLRVVIVPKWEGGPFAMNAVYTNVSNYRVKVEALKFYLGDVRLLTGTDTTLLKDIALFNMASGTNTMEWSAEPGTWTGLRAGLGVPQILNEADPISYGPGHPLNLSNGMYWAWPSMYRFLVFDGRYDLDPNGTQAPILPFSMHTGLNVVYREFDVPLENGLVISAGNTTTLTLELAVDRFFYSDTDTLDLLMENQTHGEDLPLALKLTDNAVQSFILD